MRQWHGDCWQFFTSLILKIKKRGHSYEFKSLESGQKGNFSKVEGRKVKPEEYLVAQKNNIKKRSSSLSQESRKDS